MTWGTLEDMKLSVMLNYAGDVKTMADELGVLEKAGLDCVWVAEAYSFDAISMMGYLAAKTERVEIGSAIVNVYSRTATLMAMTFAGLDYVSDGRINCGLGASGHRSSRASTASPTRSRCSASRIHGGLPRTWKREVIDYHGTTIDIPLPKGEGTGLGKPLKLINHPVRSSIPLWWASLKGKSVEATAEIADGWIPVFYIPEKADLVWGDALELGMKEAIGRSRTAPDPCRRLGEDHRRQRRHPKDARRGSPAGCAVRRRHGRPREELLQRHHVAPTDGRVRQRRSKTSTSMARRKKPRRQFPPII